MPVAVIVALILVFLVVVVFSFLGLPHRRRWIRVVRRDARGDAVYAPGDRWLDTGQRIPHDQRRRTIASTTFDELKHAVVTKAEETGALPSTVAVRGVQYTLQVPVETKMRLMQVVKNPVRFEEALDAATFVGTDGATVHA